jgi:hypothetical protein
MQEMQILNPGIFKSGLDGFQSPDFARSKNLPIAREVFD